MMLKIKYILILVSGIVYSAAFAPVQTAGTDQAYALKDNRSQPEARRILTGIELDMTAAEVQSLLGKPDQPAFFDYRKMRYGRLHIVLSKNKRVAEIRYKGRCGIVPVKNRHFDVLQNPAGLKPYVVEALSRNDLLCPGHDFQRRISECIADVMDYVNGRQTF